jgi:hypothetical protein
MAVLTDFSYGRILVDGEEVRTDLIVLPGRVVKRWVRGCGHTLSYPDLAAVLGELPVLLIVGTGAVGNLKPDEHVIETLEARGMVVEVMPTAEAVERYSRCDPVTTACALHLTC